MQGNTVLGRDLYNFYNILIWTLVRNPLNVLVVSSIKEVAKTPAAGEEKKDKAAKGNGKGQEVDVKDIKGRAMGNK